MGLLSAVAYSSIDLSDHDEISGTSIFQSVSIIKMTKLFWCNLVEVGLKILNFNETPLKILFPIESDRSFYVVIKMLLDLNL